MVDSKYSYALSNINTVNKQYDCFYLSNKSTFIFPAVKTEFLSWDTFDYVQVSLLRHSAVDGDTNDVPAVLVAQAAVTKYHGLGGSDNRHVFLTVLEVQD